MTIKNKLIILFLAWFLLGASNAFAKNHDHVQHHPQSSIVSPFDAKKDQSLHCFLRGHGHQDFCPHSKPGQSQNASIASDCGGKTAPSIPNTISFDNNFGIVSYILLHQASIWEILASHHFAIDLLDPPPITL